MKIMRRKIKEWSSLIIWKEVIQESNPNRIRLFMQKVLQILLKSTITATAVCALMGIHLITGSDPIRIFVLDNTSSTSRILKRGITPYEKQKKFVLSKIRKNDIVYTVAPETRKHKKETIPEYPSNAESDIEQSVDDIISHHPGIPVHVAADRQASSDFNSSGYVEWNSFGEPVGNIGILSGCLGEKGVYVTFVSTYEQYKTCQIDIWVNRRQQRSKSFYLSSGLSEVFLETREIPEEAEIVVRKGGDFYKGDDYLCMVKDRLKSKVYVSGNPPADPVLHFLKAIEVDIIHAPFPQREEVNVITGFLPSACPPGNYLLLIPEGNIGKAVAQGRGFKGVSKNRVYILSYNSF
jgi:hypothetical protein